ncbi:hypothetical protein OBJ93_03570 [Empedobacter falsenii]
MDNTVYNILWIDDDHESLKATKGIAKVNGINLVGFKSLNVGFFELEKKIHFYDGILLDAKFYENEDDVPGTEDDYNVHLAKEKLLQLNKKFEIFVYTGQAENFEDRTFNKVFKNVYKKGSTKDRDKLFEDIKIAAKAQKDTQIKFEYYSVFQAIQGIEALEKHQSKLLEILKDIDTDQDFTKIRLILESLFKALADVNIIPEGFTEEKGWINGTSLFLSGKHSEFEYNSPDFIHPSICETLFRVLNIVQDGSHNEGSLKLKVDDYSRKYTSGYLYKSIVYGLLEILCYFGELIRNYQDKTVNQSRWSRKQVLQKVEMEKLIEAKFLTINVSNWGKVLCIDGREVDVHPKTIEQYNLAIGEIIWVDLEFSEEKKKYHIKNITKK